MMRLAAVTDVVSGVEMAGKQLRAAFYMAAEVSQGQEQLIKTVVTRRGQGWRCNTLRGPNKLQLALTRER